MGVVPINISLILLKDHKTQTFVSFFLLKENRTEEASRVLSIGMEYNIYILAAILSVDFFLLLFFDV